MGYQRDQRLPSERATEDQNKPAPPTYAPPLPPREQFSELRIHANTEPLEQKQQDEPDVPRLQRAQFTWANHDPRHDSTESLVPSTESNGKRTLLLIYIHGFMGNETSFQAFPAHVHSLMTELVADSHIVHTKLYPRYKSRNAITQARDEFSDWLRPHESPETDVILLGHSMGGLLSAEVVLKPLYPPGEVPLAHRLLGSINFDVPFLGMHPGVVASGLGSLFRPGDKSPEPEVRSPGGSQAMLPMPDGSFDLGRSPNNSAMLYQRSDSKSETQSLTPLTSYPSVDQSSRSRSPYSIPVNDPNYNPKFENDVVRPARKGWEGALHFMTKHSGGLRQAAKAYVSSHVEFGGTMADYPKLHARYKKVRALEDVNDVNQARNNTNGPSRVRFVNFYTASTGRPKPPKSPSIDDHGRQLGHTQSSGSSDAEAPNESTSAQKPLATSPRLTADKLEDTPINSIEHEDFDGANDETPASAMQSLEPQAISDSEHEPTDTAFSHNQTQAEPEETPSASKTEASTTSVNHEEGLPPIPSLPAEPPAFDPTTYTDKHVLKLAQKDNARQIKAYQAAVKDRDKAIAERKKLIEKREKKAAKEREKAEKEAEKAAVKEARAKEKQKEKTKQESVNIQTGEADPNEPEKKKRDRKFCITPSKQNGVRDPAWVRVFMEGVDEVGAHCGLFFEDKPHYDGLIKDVGEVVRDWVLRAAWVRSLK